MSCQGPDVRHRAAPGGSGLYNATYNLATYVACEAQHELLLNSAYTVSLLHGCTRAQTTRTPSMTLFVCAHVC
jgi:hypothetical protein